MVHFDALARKHNLTAHRQMITIHRVALGIAALGVALGFAVVSRSHNDDLTGTSIAVSAAPAAAAISIWEMHNLPQVKFLPFERFEAI